MVKTLLEIRSEWEKGGELLGTQDRKYAHFSVLNLNGTYRVMKYFNMGKTWVATIVFETSKLDVLIQGMLREIE